MIDRSVKHDVIEALARQAAVALLGPRQVGKTTLAFEIAKDRPSVYLDLESMRDRSKLQDPRLFFAEHENMLVILDEIHRMPEIFQELRGIIDERRRQGNGVGHFLILGSASIDLLKQSGETLAGRIEYINIGPLNLLEIEQNQQNTLWLRGGFPDSFLSHNEKDSLKFRENFIRTYLERDIPMFGPRIPAETMGRLWTMLAHNQGALLNSSKLASGLGVSSPTVTNYISLLSDLLLVRRLNPFYTNIGKRLTKSPKIYIRDSGITHALLGISNMDELFGHPVVGYSWEGFVIENILSVVGDEVKSSFFRTAAGAEADLILEFKNLRWMIEVKRTTAPKIERSLRESINTINPDQVFIVYPGNDRYKISDEVTVIGLLEMLENLKKL